MGDPKPAHTSHSPPPTYQESVEDTPASSGFVRDDGRIDVNLDSRLSKTLSWIVDPRAHPQEADVDQKSTPSSQDGTFPIRLSIVIQVVGSRGDVQPFIALGNALQDFGHRVRLATHQKFASFVENAGLEFFPIGGDPEDLMAYMVKNPGLMPSMASLKAGDIGRKRDMVAQMLDGCWSSCIEPDPRTGLPFIADAIIANPPSFAHIHCAEALGVPVHIVFTMPWTSTTAFAHPLANVKGRLGNVQQTNFMTHVLVQWLTWQGLGDLINSWRDRLGLERVPATEGPMLAETLQIPHTYCWSPALIPKPADWGSHIDVSGFFFRKNPVYNPPQHLSDFLRAGSQPIYVGFGSIVVEDTERFSRAIVEAITRCGERAIISPGWAKLQVPKDNSNFYCLEECPHEWLFQHVSTVIHHGGAGTTAIGLREARPTIIVPFFGDQPFWADMVAAAGAGPQPIPQRQVTVERLEEAIKLCRTNDVRDAAAKLSAQIKSEDGVQAAVRAFHQQLPVSKLQCDFVPDQPACWRLRVGGKQVKLSRPAAAVLIRDAGLDAKKLSPLQTKPIAICKRRWDPATAIFSSLIGTSVRVVDGATGIILEPRRELLRGNRDREGVSRETAGPRSVTGAEKTDATRLNVVAGDQANLSSEDVTSSTSASVKEPSQAKVDGKSRQDYTIVGSVAKASGKSAGRVLSSSLRGVLVELPLATAEGFRFLPRMWGQEARHYGDVTDWQSGGLVAGKTAVFSVSEGVRDLVMHPVQGARSEGILGAAKGLGTGAGSLVSGTLSAGVGLVAYPGQGIAKSIHSLMHGRTTQQIAEARHEAGIWAARQLTEAERLAVVNGFMDEQRRGPRWVLNSGFAKRS